MSPAYWHWWLFDALRELMKHSATAIPHDFHSELALRAIDFPLLGETKLQHLGSHWPEPFEFLRPLGVSSSPAAPRTARIQQLVKAIALGEKGRHEAALRLYVLSKWGMLTDSDVKDFGAALWSITDGDRAALPANTHFLKHMFVELPKPTGIDAISRVRAQLFCLPDDLVNAVNHLTEIQNAVSRQSNPIYPDAGVAEELFEKLAHPVQPLADESRIVGRRRENIELLIGAVISLAAAPHMETSALTEERARRLLELTETGGLWAAIPALAYFVFIAEDTKLKIVERIRAGVLGASADEVMASATAIENWAINPPANYEAGVTNGLVDALINAAESGRERGAISVLGAIRRIVDQRLLSQTQIERVVRAVVAIEATTEYRTVEPSSERAVSVSILRAACVRLAVSLLPLHSGRYFAALDALIENSARDPLPEVRYAASQPG
jgi:hypothetical protein